MSLILSARPLSEAAFAPFGEVAVVGTNRSRVGERLGDAREAARPHLEIVTIAPRSLPFEAEQMERHVFSTQSFIPIDVASYLLLVAPGGSDRPDISRAVAFIARADQAITYTAGTWHLPMAPLDREGRFVVLTWRAGDRNDEEFVAVEAAIRTQADHAH